MKQTWPCDDGGTCNNPQVDCLLSEWDAWSSCDVQCGVGQKTRSRHVTRESANGGRCHEDLDQMAKCFERPCGTCEPKDCVWSSWEEWGACDKCGGQRKRFRHIQVQPACNGKICQATSSEEIADCSRKCHETTYCIWEQWMQWSDCTRTCGKDGRRSRERFLKVVRELPISAQPSIQHFHPSQQWNQLNGSTEQAAMLEQQYEQLFAKAQGIQQRRTREVVASFTLGSLSFVAAVVVARNRKRWRLGPSRHLYQTVPLNDEMWQAVD